MAKLRYIEAKRVMGMRLESAANQYTNNEVLSAADYCIPAYDIAYSPEVEEYARKLARGDYSRDKSIHGRRRGSVSFSVDLAPHATADQAPMVFMAMRGCGLQQNVNAGTGVWLTPHRDADRTPITIEVQELTEGSTPTGLKFRFFGCMGNVTGSCEQIGQPTKLRFEFSGAFFGVSPVASGSVITPASFDTADPPANMSMTLEMLSTVQFFGRYSFNLQNQLEAFDDPTMAGGVSGVRVVGRDPVFEIDPDLFTTDSDDWWTAIKSNNTTALSIALGRNLYITAPAAQPIDGYKPGSRQGHVTNQLRFGLKRSSGNDEIEIRQGTKS
jgi:hypothetical protein